MKINRKYFYWTIFYAISIIVGSQIALYYFYKGVNEKIDKFVNSRIDNERIIGFDTSHYPERGKYIEIITSSNNKYPIIIENSDDKEFIILNSTIQKDADQKQFMIDNNSERYEFTIRPVRDQVDTVKLLVFFITVVVAVSTFIKYGIKKE